MRMVVAAAAAGRGGVALRCNGEDTGVIEGEVDVCFQMEGEGKGGRGREW